MSIDEIKRLAKSILDSDDEGKIRTLLQEIMEEPIIYGKNGYSDQHDPRSLQCMRHDIDRNGKPNMVHTAVVVQPHSRYKCALVDLMTGDESCQIYVEVYDKNGNAASKNQARMLTGWAESATQYDRLYDAPASPGSFFMGRDSKFWPPQLGACGVLILGNDGNVDSDVAGSMGLPGGQHLSYRVVFRER